MNGDVAIRLENLGKHYGAVAALDNVTLEVRRAEIFGFLGLNGAGKSTTIRILLDLVRPTNGRAFIFGRHCQTHGLEARRQVGYLPGELGFYGDMTGQATLDLLGRLSAAPIAAGIRERLLDRLQLSQRDLRRKVREYSTGMKRKLGIVQAFQSEAPLLILDEPTEGLDPLMQEALYGLLDETRRSGRTVFMSSHVLPEVERICDRIGLLRQGELVLVSPVHEVKRLAARTVRVVLREDRPAPASWPDGCEVVEIGPGAWTLRVHGPLGPLMARLSALPIDDIEIREPHLEDVLRQYYHDASS
jgi:ABC-2 type transport system ATP-binding protein